MKFNDYLKELRARRFLDTDKITKLLKFERTIWRKIESGINPPPQKHILRKFCVLVNCRIYEQNQLFTLAKKWEPSPLTNTMNHIITPSIELMKHCRPNEYDKWYNAALQENTPDYKHKYWGIQLD